VQDIYSLLLKQGGALSSASTPLGVSEALPSTLHTPAPAQHMMRLLTEVHSAMQGKTSNLTTRSLPIADTQASFTLPTGYRPEQLWRQWFGGRPRPWRFIVNKNLATKQERNLLKKYKDVMEAMRCRVPVTWIEADIDGSFRACWTKFCQVSLFSVTCKWSCAYMYDKLTKEIEERLASSPMLSAPEFLAGKAAKSLRAALHDVEIAEGRVSEAALSNLPAAISAASRAQRAADVVAGVVAQVNGVEEELCLQCWICAQFYPPHSLQGHFRYKHEQELEEVRKINQCFPCNQFAGMLALWRENSTRFVCSRRGLTWEPIDTTLSTNTGQLWHQREGELHLYVGTLHKARCDAAGGAGKLAKRSGSESVVYGRFIGQCTLDLDHFSIEISTTYAKWGIASGCMQCEKQ
jgi:hypothetical protein